MNLFEQSRDNKWLNKIRSFVVETSPPIVLRYAKGFLTFVLSGHDREGNEKDSEWYDRNFLLTDQYRVHYTKSRYYFLWSIIADRILSAGISSILEVGCGPGQFARLLHDRGFKSYTGFDFSPKRIEHARMNCPDFTFYIADALHADLYEKVSYDAVVCTEFLEHIEKDIEVISCIRRGVKVYASVPNRSCISHVRYFNNTDEVYARYLGYFDRFHVDGLLADNQKNSMFFLMEGIKK